jgi:hypothetical protein
MVDSILQNLLGFNFMTDNGKIVLGMQNGIDGTERQICGEMWNRCFIALW